jgi:hypothetical protein
VVLSVVPVVCHRRNRYSDNWNNGKYHRVIHSYISINGDKHCRNVPVVAVAVVPEVLVTVD